MQNLGTPLPHLCCWVRICISVKSHGCLSSLQLEKPRSRRLPSGGSSFIIVSTNSIFFCRLLEELVQKEKELQALLHQAIEEKDQEIKHLKLKSQPIGE